MAGISGMSPGYALTIYIIHSELPDKERSLTGLNLCEIIDEIVPDDTFASLLHNGVRTICLKSKGAQQNTC